MRSNLRSIDSTLGAVLPENSLHASDAALWNCEYVDQRGLIIVRRLPGRDSAARAVLLHAGSEETARICLFLAALAESSRTLLHGAVGTGCGNTLRVTFSGTAHDPLRW